MKKLLLKLAALASLISSNAAFATPLDVTICDGAPGKTAVMYARGEGSGSPIEVAKGLQGSDADALVEQIRKCVKDGGGETVKLKVVVVERKKSSPVIYMPRGDIWFSQ